MHGALCLIKELGEGTYSMNEIRGCICHASNSDNHGALNVAMFPASHLADVEDARAKMTCYDLFMVSLVTHIKFLLPNNSLAPF